MHGLDLSSQSTILTLGSYWCTDVPKMPPRAPYQTGKCVYTIASCVAAMQQGLKLFWWSLLPQVGRVL
jgi:hypothetical protein